MTRNAAARRRHALARAAGAAGRLRHRVAGENGGQQHAAGDAEQQRPAPAEGEGGGNAGSEVRGDRAGVGDSAALGEHLIARAAMQVGQQSADDARQHSAGKPDQRAAGDAGRRVAGDADRQQAADAAGHADQAGPAPADGGDHPFGVEAGRHHPGGQRARVQADGGIAQPQLVAQEGDDVALDADDEGEEPAQQIGVPGQACSDQAHGPWFSAFSGSARVFPRRRPPLSRSSRERA